MGTKDNKRERKEKNDGPIKTETRRSKTGGVHHCLDPESSIHHSPRKTLDPR